MKRAPEHQATSSLKLIVGLMTAVVATVAVFALVNRNNSSAPAFSDDWDDIVGM